MKIASISRITVLAREAAAAVQVAAGWARRGLALGVSAIDRATVLAGVPFALLCFRHALRAVNPDGFAHLALRYTDVFGAKVPVQVVNLAFWPLHYLYLIAFPAAGLAGHRLEAIGYVAAGIAALVVVNVGHLNRQTLEDPAGRAALWLWIVSMALTVLDLARCVLLPPAWDLAPLIGNIPNGAALRAAEIVVSVYLWSLYLVTAKSRVNIGRTRTWAQISIEVRRTVILQGAVMIALGPVVVGFIATFFGEKADKNALHIVVGAVVAIYVGLIVGSPLFDACLTMIRYGIALLSDGNLLVRKHAPPSSPKRW